MILSATPRPRARRLPLGRAAALLLCAAAAGSCGARYVRTTEPPSGTPPPGLTRHVLVVSIDGLRPDAIAAFAPPTLQRLVREGGYTLSASTIDPSKTLPSHTSMLTGEPPERHQVLWNTAPTAKKKFVELPNIFSVAREHGYRTAAFFSKSKFHVLQRPGTLDYSQAPGGWFGRWPSDRTLADVGRYLSGAKPNVLFVHLSDPDAAGHRAGWMSAEYAKAVRAADAAVADLIDLADDTYGAGEYALIVTADHGGHDRDHGSRDPRDVTIPWIAWGQGVKPGALPPATVRTMDTAATVLWLLGVPEPGDWAGTPVTLAFHPGTEIAAGNRE